ncbi:hypothetical protein PCE1_000645 [Barthelona sp. PCE]
MFVIFRDDHGRACVKQQLNTTTNDVEVTQLREDDDFTGDYWVSQDESTLAIVYSFCIRFFRVPSFELFHVAEQQDNELISVSHGCLSADGKMFTFCLNKGENKVYNSIRLESDFVNVSSISFKDGGRCWVNSKYIIIQKGKEFYRLVHEEPKESSLIKGNIVVQDRNNEMYVIHRHGFFSTKIDVIDAEGSVESFSELEKVRPIEYADISEQYLVIGNKTTFQVYHRQTREVVLQFDRECDIQSILISRNQQHISYVEDSYCVVCDIRERKRVAEVCKTFVRPTTMFKVLDEELILLKNTDEAFICFKKTIILCESKYFVYPIHRGFLLFFNTRVFCLKEDGKKCNTYECHEGNVVDVSIILDSSLLNVKFEDGTRMLLEWSPINGFGRTAKCKNLDLDSDVSINDLCFILAEQLNEKQTFEQQLREQEQRNEELLAQITKMNEKAYEEQPKDKDQQNEELLAENTKMKEKFQAIYEELNKDPHNFGKEYYTELISRVDACSNEIKELVKPPQSFFDWLSSNPTVDSIFDSLGNVNMAKEFVNNLRSVVERHGFTGHLRVSFGSQYNIIAENPIIGILHEDKMKEKMRELLELNPFFDCYNQCLELNYQALFLDNTSNAINLIDIKFRNIQEDMNKFRSIKHITKAINKTNFNSLFSIKEQINNYQHDVSTFETTLFSNARNALIAELSDIQQSLNDIIREVSFENVDIIAALEELNLSTINFPFVPKVINIKYAQGTLRFARTWNSVQFTDDLCLKCFCFSSLYLGDKESNLKDLRHELRVLTRSDPCVVELKGVTLVYDQEENEDPTLEFVCLELERAPYDLEQYLTEFPDLNEDTKISIAKQLVKCVLTMHTRGIMLRDIKPNNALVFCDEDGNNPIIKLCDFSDSIDPQNTLSRTIAAAAFYIPPEVARGGPHTIMGDIFSLGRTICRVFGSPIDINEFFCPHSDILKKCEHLEPLERPSIYELALKWDIDFDLDVRKEMTKFLFERQELENETMLHSEYYIDSDDFSTVFSKIREQLSENNRRFFKDAIITVGDQRLHLTQYIRYLFQHRFVPPITLKSTDTDVKNMCTFLYCCLVFQAPIDDSQVGNFVLNALSCDFDKLSDAAVFARAFPMQSLSFQNIASDDNLNFNLYGGEDVPVTDENRETFVEEEWSDRSEYIHDTFHDFDLPEQLRALSFNEIKAIMCEPPRFTAEKVLKALKFVDDMPEDLKESFETLLHGLYSLELTHFVHWLNGSTKLPQFTVSFHQDDTKPPLVNRVMHTLHIPNDAQHISEVIRSAIRNTMPNDLKFRIFRTLSRYSTNDVQELNNQLENALDIDITINGIDNVPSVRACPRCCTMVTYDGGCKRVKCPLCNFLFCFSCLSSICNPAGQCKVAPTQKLTFEQVQDSIHQFS